MEKSKALYQTVALQSQQQSFNDMAAQRYRATTQDDNEARGYLDQSRSKNMMIEEVWIKSEMKIRILTSFSPSALDGD